MNPDQIRQYCDTIDAQTQLIRDELIDIPPEPPTTVIAEGDDLQAALTAGGAYELAFSSAFATPKGYQLPTPDTRLAGQGENTLTGETSPAVTIPINTRNYAVERVQVGVSRCEIAVHVGKNDTSQVTREAAPTGVRFRGLTSQSHRGKRVFEINGADVEFTDCTVMDAYDPEGQDSQAIWIGNAPGPVTVVNSYLVAASENVMVGGDAMKIPNCRPTGITFRHSVFTKPMAWMSAGTPKVKNLFELKDGNDVLIDDCEFSQCWDSAQDGYCYMLTPSQGGSLRNVVIKNNRVWQVGGIANIVGLDGSNINPDRSQISFLGGDYRTNSAEMGGRGIFALVGRGPEWVILEDLTASIDGPSFIDVYDPGVDLLRIVGSTWNYGSYGVRLKGYSHGDNQMGAVKTIVIEGNTITGAHSSFRNRYPNNTYVENMTRDRELEVESREADHNEDFARMLKRMRRWAGEYRL